MDRSGEEVKQKEIIVIGMLAQFRGVVEIEQHRTARTDMYDDYRSNILPLRLLGPMTGTTGNGSVLRWLVINGAHIVFDMLAIGRSSGAGGPWGYLALSPDMSLDDMDREAQKLRVSLSKVLRTGEMRAVELPNGRIRIVFNVSGFDSPSAFWQWMDGLVQEMERQGFTPITKDKVNDIQRLMYQHQRRLQKLREQAAFQGSAADPKIVMEIEDIEEEIAKLQAQLST